MCFLCGTPPFIYILINGNMPPFSRVLGGMSRLHSNELKCSPVYWGMSTQGKVCQGDHYSSPHVASSWRTIDASMQRGRYHVHPLESIRYVNNLGHCLTNLHRNHTSAVRQRQRGEMAQQGGRPRQLFSCYFP